MKRILLLAVFVLTLTSADAQKLHYGFFAGTNLSTMELETALYLNTDSDNCKTPFLVGFREGLFVEYSFLNFLGIQGEVSFGEYGYRMKLSDTKELPVDGEMFYTNYEGSGKTVINDISVSLLLKFYLFKQHLSIDLGTQPSWTLSAYRKESLLTTVTNSDGVILGQEPPTEYDGAVEYFNKENFSVIGGATYYINPKIFVSARYMFGLKDVLTKSAGYVEGKDYVVRNIDQKSRHRVIQLAFGFRFR